MTSVLRSQLHRMVDMASSDHVIHACLSRSDVCRFILHTYVDYMTNNGDFDRLVPFTILTKKQKYNKQNKQTLSGFQVLIDWSEELQINFDSKTWQIDKKQDTSPSQKHMDIPQLGIGTPPFASSSHPSRHPKNNRTINSTNMSPMALSPHDDGGTLPRLAPSNIAVDTRQRSIESNVSAESPRADNEPTTPKTPTLTSRSHSIDMGEDDVITGRGRGTSNTQTSQDVISDLPNGKTQFYRSKSSSISMGPKEHYISEDANPFQTLSMDNRSRRSILSVASDSSEESKEPPPPRSVPVENTSSPSKRSVFHSVRDALSRREGPRVNVPVVPPPPRVVTTTLSSNSTIAVRSNANSHSHSSLAVTRSQGMSLSTSRSRSDSHSMTASSYYSTVSTYDYIRKLSHDTWISIAGYLDTSTKAGGLARVNRELNLITTHPLCWKKLTVKVGNLGIVPKHVINRSFKALKSFELDWSESEVSICGYSRRHSRAGRGYAHARGTGQRQLMLYERITDFFKILCKSSMDTLHTFKLRPGGGPFRLANSAPTSSKFEETDTLIDLVISNFVNLRKIKMDAYNIVGLTVFEKMMTTFQPNLEFLEVQTLVFERGAERPALDTPVSLSKGVLPATLRHLSLPLLADDTWVTRQHLPNLEYLFFFGFSRSSAFALGENRLSVACLNHIAGVLPNRSENGMIDITSSLLTVPQAEAPKIIPNCPKIKCIEIALRETDYMAIILRPVIRKLFQRCNNLLWLKLATGGKLELAHTLYKSLVGAKLSVCDAYARVEGRPERPTGYVEFRKLKSKQTSNTNKRRQSLTESGVSEIAVACRLRSS